jgi:hypothetical protein
VQRVRSEVNVVPTGTSRSVVSILASDRFTWFNVLLGVLGAVILVIGRRARPEAGLVLLVNTP